MKRLISIFLFSLFFVGCLEEDRGYCPTNNIRFDLSYTFNMSSTDLLPHSLGSIIIFVFDGGGRLVGDFVATTDDIARGFMDADLRAGMYTFVAWGTSGADLRSGGYRVEGTRLDDFRLHLDTPEAFDDLYYSIHRDVMLFETESVTIPLEFMRHTNIVNVRVRKGAQATRAEASVPQIYVTGRKGLYGHDGMVHRESPSHRYDARDYAVQSNDVRAMLHLQRFDVDFHTDDNTLWLNIERDGVPLIVPLDLVSTLRLNPAYAEQAALDRNSVFNIDIWIKAPTSIQIDIDGWVVQNIGVQIGTW